jgi:hypothetical protein
MVAAVFPRCKNIIYADFNSGECEEPLLSGGLGKCVFHCTLHLANHRQAAWESATISGILVSSFIRTSQFTSLKRGYKKVSRT